MRANHKRIRARVNEAKSKITDQELFGSIEYAGYLSDISEAIGRRYKRRVLTTTLWDEAPYSSVASTNNRKITINCGHPMIQELPTRVLKALSISGLQGHELGHVFFTDFYTDVQYITSLMGGYLYPEEPKDLLPSEDLNLAELRTVLRDDQAAAQIICETVHDIVNILEDAYIEERMVVEFPGRFAKGIALNQLRFVDTVPSVLTEIKEQHYEFSIMRNLLLQYCAIGEINNLGGYSGEYLDKLNECIYMVDNAVNDTDFRVRCNCANRIIIKWWKYLKVMVEEMKEKRQQAGGNSIDPQALQSIVDEILGKLAAQSPSRASDPNGSGKGTKGKFVPDNSLQDERDELEKVLAEETARIALSKTEEISNGQGGSVIQNRLYTGSGYTESANDISRLLNTIAEDRTNQSLEQELSAELQAESRKVRYGNAHKGVNVIVNRMVYVDDYLRQQYEQVSAPLRQISKQLQKQIQRLLLDREEGGRQNNLPYGARLNTRAFATDSGMYYYNMKLPEDFNEMAIAVLNDMSGSMSGNDRLTTARAASITLYDFCTALGIPVMIMGHNDKGGNVQLYSYADFDSVDRKDRYRIMDMSSGGCNRDGAALRYVAERLMKRPEPVKILMLISDGQPNSDNYRGTEAEADLRGIRQEYTRKGIKMIAAAIGDDRPNIKRIYEKGFLDITDLSKLPVMLTKILSEEIRKVA